MSRPKPRTKVPDVRTRTESEVTAGTRSVRHPVNNRMLLLPSDTTNLPTKQAAWETAGFPKLAFARPMSPNCCLIIDFLFFGDGVQGRVSLPLPTSL
jgi:hypothetical protein